MNISALTRRELKNRLRTTGLGIHVGPFTYNIHTVLSSVCESLNILYGDYTLSEPDEWVDFDVKLERSGWLYKLFKPQTRLRLNHIEPFTPFSTELSGAILEWGMNWCITLNVTHLKIFHAAMLERNHGGVILAADSGMGKSTLAAALSFSGWRLLSDELTLLDPKNGMLVPVPRPICLKNDSISLIRQFAPQAVFSQVYLNTDKGTVAHVRPLRSSVEQMYTPTVPRWVVFPEYRPGATSKWTPWDKAEALLHLTHHEVTPGFLGEQGFHVLTDMIKHCECFKFTYSRLEDARDEFIKLSDGL